MVSKATSSVVVEKDVSAFRRANDRTVVVVGAGLAGLSAALHLHDHLINVVVLEAQSQAGGRVRSTSLGDASFDSRHITRTVELGATFFHGTRGNAAYDLSVLNGLHLPQAADNLHHGNVHIDLFSRVGKLVSQSGNVRPISPVESSQIAQHYASAIAQLTSKLDKEERHEDISVLHYLRAKVGYNSLTLQGRAIFRACDLLESVIDGCGSSTESLSSLCLSEYQVLPGADLQSTSNCGMYGIVHALTSQLPDDKMICNAEVTRVSYGSETNQGVVVQLADGTRITADCVIWTPSLNVTKAACKTSLFCPAFSAAKLLALHARSQGVVERVYAILKSPLRDVAIGLSLPVFWEGSLGDGIGPPRETDPSSPLNPLSESSDWCHGIYAVEYDEVSLCVDFWLAGGYAMALSSREDERAKSEMSKVLSVIYDQPVAVHDIVRSNWGRNRFIQGGYSYPSVGCPADVVHDLAAPLPSAEHPLLCFAGEATHPMFYSTMHGAIESGIREARRCVAFLAPQT